MNFENLPPPTPSPVKFRESRCCRISAVSAIALLFHAGFTRCFFAENWMKDAGGAVSISFIARAPFARGANSAEIAEIARWRGNEQWLVPAVVGLCSAMLLGLAICILLKIEAMICVIMAFSLA